MNKTELMNDIFGWDIGTWSKAYPIWKECIDKNNYKKGLEIGNAFGGGSLFLAKNEIHMVCSNIHTTDQKTKQIHLRHNVSDKIKYDAIDAKKINYADNYFDVIFAKSILGFFTLFFLRFKLLYKLALFLDFCFFFVPNKWKYISYGYATK